jgi:serine/threonine protein kinase
MTPERWGQIQEVFHRAVECDGRRRDLLLDEACNGDLELRREVEALLSSDSRARRRVQAAIDAEIHDFGFSMVGEVVSHYRILDALGGGGMGLVYRAEDVKLGRQVAVKFLPEESANSPVALARFEREARAASALEHPNICPIHEFGEHLGQSFLVMQLLEGQTLRELLESGRNTTQTGSASKSRSSGALPVDRILDLGIQIADGLEAAHQKGIIHRDIKPANIFVTSKGEAKILDFGLAKLNGGPADEGDKPERTWPSVSEIERETELPETPDPLLTRTGVAMGTAGYMSPEQARGEKLDARSDIFSFGLVLYEMATGQRAFPKETGPVLRAAILNETPMPVRKLNPKAPYKLERIITKTLEKNCTARYQSASEIRADLKTLKREMEPKRRWAALSAGVFILLLAISAAFWFFRRQQLTVQSRPEPKVRQLTANSFENRVTSGAISPDGKYLAYADINGMYMKSIETGETRAVPEPDELKNKSVEWDIPATAWFRDNTRFVSNAHPASERGDWSSLTTSVWVFSRISGASHQLRDKALAWSVSPDTSLISFGTNKGRIGDREVWLMDPNGDHARKLYDTDEDNSICCLTWSPDEQRVMYIKFDHSGVTLINRDLKGGPPTTIFTPSEMNSINNAAWLPDGRLIYALRKSPDNDETCNYWTMQLDSPTGGLIAKPRRLTNWTGGFCMDDTSMTADGKKLAFLKSALHLTSYMAEWPAGGKRALKLRHFPLSERSEGVADWTVDSKEVILASSRGGNFGIYKQALNEETAEPLVTEGYGRSPRATPDGKWVLYLGPTENGAEAGTTPQPVMRVSITGGPSKRLFTARRRGIMTCARSPSHLCVIGEPTDDGKQMTVTAIDFLKGRGPELFRFALRANDDTWWLDLSPDGRRVAATQTQAGPIYILSLGGQVLQQVRLKGWSNLLRLTWAADGKGLFVTAGIRNGQELLHVDLQGHVHALWESTGGFPESLAPSPDGHHLAIQNWTTSGNIWMMEDF